MPAGGRPSGRPDGLADLLALFLAVDEVLQFLRAVENVVRVRVQGESVEKCCNRQRAPVAQAALSKAVWKSSDFSMTRSAPVARASSASVSSSVLIVRTGSVWPPDCSGFMS